MKDLTSKMQEQVDKMVKTGNLFRSTVDGDTLWNIYLQGFGEDPIFRSPESSEHNCNHCKSFVKRYGNIIAFDEDYNLMTIWDICPDEEYANSVKSVSEFIRNNQTTRNNLISDIFIESFKYLEKVGTNSKHNKYRLGLDYNIKRYTKEEAEKYPNSGIKPNDVIQFNHFHIYVPKSFINTSSDSNESIMGEIRSQVQVFKRGLDEISMETLYLVRDLGKQGSLLNYDSYNGIINKVIEIKEEYDELDEHKKEVYVWLNRNCRVSHFRNTAIGTLLVELSKGEDINSTVKSFNRMVDPINYMKATAPITKKQISEAEKFVEENGYDFERRCATIEDINTSEILHSNVSSIIKKISIFDKVKPTTSSKKNNFNNIKEIGIETFMSEILPKCSTIEAYINNKYEKNFVNLLTSVNKESKGLFKWNNNFSWTYNGNLAGKSQIKQAVKQAGGFVDAPFRFSIMWNEDGRSIVDFDAHAQEPHGEHIYYATYKGIKTNYSGSLDIDMIRPKNVGVENIFWTDMNKVKNGAYKFWINNYDHSDNTGCKAEIFINGETFYYHVPTRIQKDVTIATVFIKNGQLDHIEHSKYLVEEHQQTIYGLDTNQFHKVNLICLSPNYWQEQGVGNKHYFFMLENAQNTEKIRSIHNEFLNEDLRKHRKVMEVLGSTLKVDSTKGQLCGIGFNSTVRDEVILRIDNKQVIKVKF